MLRHEQYKKQYENQYFTENSRHMNTQEPLK